MTIIAARTRGRTSFFAGSPPERADRVDLLGHVHRADLGGHSAADAAADDDGRERRAELAQERQHDDARDVLDAAEALQAEGELDGHDHPDEDRRDGDDAQRAHAERLDLVDGRRDLERPPRDRPRATATVSVAHLRPCARRTRRRGPRHCSSSVGTARRRRQVRDAPARRHRRHRVRRRGIHGSLARSPPSPAAASASVRRPPRSARSRPRRRRSGRAARRTRGRRRSRPSSSRRCRTASARRRASRGAACAGPRGRRRGRCPARRTRARSSP